MTKVIHLGLRLLIAAPIWHELNVHAETYTFTTIAGYSGYGAADGSYISARFWHPNGLAVDGRGNSFVADTANHCIRLITSNGAVTTIAGSSRNGGYADGAGHEAEFYWPFGIAVDAGGVIYVADSGTHTIRRVVNAGTRWEVNLVAGMPGQLGSADGTNGLSQFYRPFGIAVDAMGSLYVADRNNHTIRKATRVGTNWAVSTLAGSPGNMGWRDGRGTNALFSYPWSVATDRDGNVYVADWGGNSIRIVTQEGVVRTLAGSGFPGNADGIGTAAGFWGPEGVTVDNAGVIYVSDSHNRTIRKVTADGRVITVAGVLGNWPDFENNYKDGPPNVARFRNPGGIVVDAHGNILVADVENNVIRKISDFGAGAVSTLAGLVGGPGSDDGVAEEAEFRSPLGIAIDTSGNLFVADSGNNTIRRITSLGVVSTFVGVARKAGSTDGTRTNARLSMPSDLAIDGSGALYVADTANNTIRKITKDGFVSTFAGLAGSAGDADGSGASARFYFPRGVALDQTGNLYVTDQSNHTIRQITPAGLVITFAGLTGNPGSADGLGSAARFRYPGGIAVDRFNTIYVADSGNETVRKITPHGLVTTIAGSVGQSGTNDGVDARFSQPGRLAVDSTRTLYVTDSGNGTVRAITPDGRTTTIGGFARSFGDTDGLGSAARFSSPSGITVDESGDIYVSDSANHTIRKGVANGGKPIITVPPRGQVTGLGGSASLNVTASGATPLKYQWAYGGSPLAGLTSSVLYLNNVQLSNAGDYTVKVSNNFGSVTSAVAQLVVVLQTNRPPTDAEIGGHVVSTNTLLKTFSDGTFQNGITLDTTMMTIVMTHGWKSHPRVWATNLAALILQRIGGRKANIVAWDWSADADTNLVLASSQTTEQGRALAESLLRELGPNYSKPLHFIGHSLGTLVNANAANHLHSLKSPRKSATAFNPTNTHVTCFDEAELAPGVTVTGEGNVVSLAFNSPVPRQAAWIDNYISAVGLPHKEAANVILTQGAPTSAPDLQTFADALARFHGYPCLWYGNSVTNYASDGLLMGHRWSFERTNISVAPSKGKMFIQRVQSSELDLVEIDYDDGANLLIARSLLYAGGLHEAAVTKINSQVLRVVGQVTAEFQRLGNLIIHLFPGGRDVQAQLGGHSPHTQVETNFNAYTWIPLAIPSNTSFVSFDFWLSGEGENGVFAVAVNGTNVLSVRTSLVQSEVTLNSGRLDVARWSGKNVEIFAGLFGVSANAQLTMSNLTFFEEVPPTLQVQAAGNRLRLSWPLWASQYLVERDEEIAAGSWTTLTNMPRIENLQNTIQTIVPASTGFFRLRRE